jgi:pimeloyl-ACP methyl ester carboxylesterase
MSAYTSIKDIAASFNKVLKYIIAAHFENLKLMPKVTCPTFFVHGKSDTLINYHHSERLHEACKGSHKLMLLPDHMTHNDFDYHDDIIEPFARFLYTINFETGPTEQCQTI